MKTFPLHYLIFWLILSSLSVLSAQNTEALFTIPGLTINAYHHNVFDGTESTSYSFVSMERRCDTESLLFVNNQNHQSLVLQIEEGQVYKLSYNCNRELLYDFDLEVGEVVPPGLFRGFTVVQKDTITLSDGRPRRSLELINHIENISINWVEGIGEINQGLYPRIWDFEGYGVFVCAKINDLILWENPNETARCDSLACQTPYLLFSLNTEDDLLTIRDSSLFVTNYEWDLGDGTTSNEAELTHQYDAPACYLVNLLATNQCNVPVEVNTTVSAPICQENYWPLSMEFSWLRNPLRLHYVGTNHLIVTGPEGTMQNTYYESRDNGVSWQQRSVPSEPGGARRFVENIDFYDELNGIAVCGHYSGTGDEAAILVTHDGGETWVEKEPGSYYMHGISLHPNGTAWAVGAGFTDQYFISFDYGETWQNYTISPTVSLSTIQQLTDGTLFSLAYEGLRPVGRALLAHSSDQGRTWTFTPCPPGIGRIHFFTADHGVARNTEGVIETQDRGLTWTVVATHLPSGAISWSEPGTGWLRTHERVVYRIGPDYQLGPPMNCGGVPFSNIIPVSRDTAWAYSYNRIYQFDPTPSLACPELDFDQDGYPRLVDCADDNPAINPGAGEIPDNDIDENCDNILTHATSLANLGWDLYPNPTYDWLYLDGDWSGNITLRLIDVFGREVKHLETLTHPAILDLQTLPNGMYWLQIKEERNYNNWHGPWPVVKI